jgi:hypothetical protein
VTRRERLERRLEKRREWAASRERKRDQRFAAAGAISDRIPFGQPILVGHHSERGHRRDLARIETNISRGVEDHKMAERHEQAADELARSLDRSIFSDDDDAIEQLETRIAEREANRERGKKINAAWRRAGKPDPLDPEAWAAFAAKVGAEDAAEAADGLRYQRRADVPGLFSFAKPYDPTHDGANIRRDQKRIEEIKRDQKRRCDSEAAGGVLISRRGERWCEVTFAEKPERSTLEDLKAAGFRWASGSWVGEAERLPASVAAHG